MSHISLGNQPPRKGGALKSSSSDNRGASGRGWASPVRRSGGGRGPHRCYLRSSKSLGTESGSGKAVTMPTPRSAQRVSPPSATPNRGRQKTSTTAARRCGHTHWSVLVDVESILNSRPLCPLNTLPEDGLEVLTPALFGGKTSQHYLNSH